MSDGRDEVDDLIDDAARRLVAGEAPSDLRARVLSRLEVGATVGHGRRGWMMGGGLAAAAILAVVALRLGRSEPDPSAPQGSARVAAPAAASIAAPATVASPAPPSAATPRVRLVDVAAARSRLAGEDDEVAGLDAPLEPEPLDVAPQITEPLSMAALDVPRVVLAPLDAIAELDSATEER